jgi:hypothetical protein
MKSGTLENACLALGDALLQMGDVLVDDGFPKLLVEISLDTIPAAVLSDATVATGCSAAAQAIVELPATLDGLIDAIERDDTSAAVSAVSKVLDEIARIVTAMKAIADALSSVSASLPAGADRDALAGLAAVFPLRVIDYALIRYLEGTHRAVLGFLQLVGLAERTPIFTYSIDGETVLAVRRRMHWDRIGGMIKDPLDWFQRYHGWGTTGFKSQLLFENLGGFIDALGLVSWVDYNQDKIPDFTEIEVVDLIDPTDATTPYTEPTSSPPPYLNLWGVHVLRADRPAPAPPGVEIKLVGAVSAGTEINLAQITDNWRLALTLAGGAAADASLVITPPFDVVGKVAGGTLSGDVALKVIGESADKTEKMVLLGIGGGTRLEAKRVEVGFGGGLIWATDHATAEVSFELRVKEGKLVIDVSQADGFLKKVLPAEGLAVNFDFALGWSKSRGVYFDGGAGFEVTLPVHLSLAGVLDVDSVTLGMSVDTAHLNLSVGGSVTVALGPVRAAIDKMGLKAELAFKQGNLGPVDLALGFKPPTGIGIAVDAGPVSGGGFLSFDHDNQRYAGILNLQLLGISVTAIGLLDTKLPGGKPGFSFLILIAVEFTPIQLGFGFTLNGIGGLAGINRTLVTQALQDGVRKGGLDSILFPRDPIKRATQIISDLRSIFPPAEGRYVFGPMLKIGWGLWVSAEIGVILELPSPIRIALLGKLDAVFPTREAAVVELHLDVVGIIDFDKKQFSLDASLHDSRIALFNIAGDMAMRLCWGDDPSFALSVGGFNPHFQPPAGFPALKRLSLSLDLAEVVHLSLQAYFAITSNSLQFGAKLELYLHLGPLQINGFLGIDALFIFSPFSFIVDFEAGLAVKIGSMTLLGIHLKGTMAGPTPWHITGEASLTVLFFEVSVSVDVTFGDSQTHTLPSTDPWPALQAAMNDARNWAGVLPRGAAAVVSFSAPEGKAAPVLMDPVGAVSLRQKVLPFDQRITRFNESVTEGPDHYTLTGVSINNQPATFDPLDDQFAPAQYREMSDEEKLSGPSFVQMHAGFTVAGDAVRLGAVVSVPVEYATIPLGATTLAGFSGLSPVHTLRATTAHTFAQRGPAARSTLARSGMSKFTPTTTRLVELAEELYFIIEWPTPLATPIVAPTSKGLAQAALATYLSENPEARGTLRVVSAHDYPDLGKKVA